MNKSFAYLIGIFIVVLSAAGCVINCKVVYKENKSRSAPAPTPVPAPAPKPVPNSLTATDDVNYKSAALTAKAWQAFQNKDLNTVLMLTNQCISLYAPEAAKMQKGLSDYPVDDQKIFSYWALNDVATCLYIKGEALRGAKRMDEAKESFNRIINEFAYGQTFDKKKNIFWKPVDAAQDSIFMIDNHLDLDFGDMTSAYLVQQMWQSLADKDLSEVLGYDMKLDHLYRDEAIKMNKSLKDYPAGSNDDIFKYWALNDLGTGTFIVAEAYRMSNKNDEAIKAYNKIAVDYLYAQCWDPQGWFWRPAEVAQQKIVEIQAQK